MKKFFVIFIALISAIVLCVIAFFSLTHDRVSSKLIKANHALSMGNKSLAYDIFLDVAENDPSCEEAFVSLAKISEENCNYMSSCYFWSVASNLNNFEKSYRANAYKSAIISKNYNYLTFRYKNEIDKKSLGDEFLYHSALAFIRKDDKVLAKEIIDGHFDNPKYIEILKAYTSLRNSSIFYDEAKKNLNTLCKGLDNEEDKKLKDYVNLNLALVNILLKDYESAKGHLDMVSDKNILILGDKHILLAQYYLSKGDYKNTMDNYIEAFRFQRYNDALALDGAELASMNFDISSIAKIKSYFPRQFGMGNPLHYYFTILEFAAKNDWDNVILCLRNPNRVIERDFLKILTLKTAILKRDYSLLEKVLISINPNSLGKLNRKSIATELSSMIDFSNLETSKGIAEKVIQFDSENEVANRLLMFWNTRNENFYNVSIYASMLLKLNKEDTQAYCNLSNAMIKLGEYQNCVDLASERLKNNPEDLNALIFQSRAYCLLKEFSKANMNYKKLIHFAQNNYDVAEEIGNFFFLNNLDKDLVDFADRLCKAENHQICGLGYFLLAWKSMRESDNKDALENLNKALLIYPSYDKAFFMRATIYYFSNDIQNTLESAKKILGIDNQDDLKIRYAILLSNSDNVEILKCSKEILNNIGQKYKDKYEYNFISSELCHKLGDIKSAFIFSEKCNFKNPNYKEIIYNRALDLYKESKSDEAMSLLMRRSEFEGNSKMQELFCLCIKNYLKSINENNIDLQMLQKIENILKGFSQTEDTKNILEQIQEILHK